MVVRKKQGKLYAFGSAKELLPTSGQEIRVRGRFDNSVRFTDLVKVESQDPSGLPSFYG